MMKFCSTPTNNPTVSGFLVRAAWSDIEPSPGQFDFSRIDEQIKNKGATTLWSLAIIAGPSTPQHVKDGCKCVSFSHRGEVKTMPVFWDDHFLACIDALMQALAAKYWKDSSLFLVYVPQSSQNGIEGLLPAKLASGTWEEAGYTADAHAAAIIAATDSARVAFPGVRVAVELHETFGTTDAQAQVLDYTKQHPDVGVAVWWNGQGTYQSSLQKLIASSGEFVYCQNIAAYAKDPGRFCDYNGAPVGPEWAEQMATDMGGIYLEHWIADL